MLPKDAAEILSGKQTESSAYQSWQAGNTTELMNETGRWPVHPIIQLSKTCNVMLEMKCQVQRKKQTLLSELIKGAVLLGFTPSASRTTLDIPVPQSMLSDNEMTLPLQLVPAEVSALLRRWKQGPAVAFPHTHLPSLSSFHVFPNSHPFKNT